MSEKAILIGVITPKQNKNQTKEFLEELSFLARTARAEPIKKVTQKLFVPDNKTFIGKGKIDEVKQLVKKEKIELIIFDDDLTPLQFKNIENIFECKILDRSNLILDIFASRAKTAHAKVQVELAQYQYILPRLTRMWTHLERQKGGIGLRGPGETQIETDRRIIKQKISLLKKQLIKIDKQKITQRKNRKSMIRVTLVGYTNSGKSTLMNQLSKSDVFVEDKLFVTLDTTVRKVVIENLPFLLTDTVGFIRKLPHQLIESFKSTLDEVRESDLLLHVVDISNPSFESQIEVVNHTLFEIGVSEKPIILVFNKIDSFTFIEKESNDLTPKTKRNISLEDLKKTWPSRMQRNTIFISALHRTYFDELKKLLYKKVKRLHIKRYPYYNFLY